MKRFLSILAALALSLTIAVPVFAASSTTTETLTVPASLSVAGVPSSIDYGTLSAGQTGSKNIVVTVNGNTAWNLTISGTPFTSGANSIGEYARKGTINVTSGSPATQYPGLGSAKVFGSAPYDGTTPVMTGTAGTGNVVFGMQLDMTVPGGTPAGNYTGSVTFTVN